MLETKRPLFTKLSQVYEAVKHHPQRFQKPVIGPLIVEVTVPDENIARYLEMQVPLTAWTFFIVHCDEDERTLKSYKPINGEINIIKLTESHHEQRSPEPDLSKLAQ